MRDFDASLPLSKDVGVVLTGFQSNKYNEQHLSTTLYTATGTGAWVMQWRIRPSAEYCDHKCFSCVPQAASSWGMTVCQWSVGNTTGKR